MTPEQKIDKIEQKTDKIFDMLHAQNVEIAKFLVKSEQYDKTGKDVEQLKKNQNTVVGVFGTISVAIPAFFSWLFNKHN